MQFSSFALSSVLAMSAGLVAADTVPEMRCQVGNGMYCDGGSLETQYILSCLGPTSANRTSCDSQYSTPPAGGSYCYYPGAPFDFATCVSDCECSNLPNGTFYALGCKAKGLPRGSPCTIPITYTNGTTVTPAPVPIYSSGANADGVAPSGLLSLLFAAAGLMFSV